VTAAVARLFRSRGFRGRSPTGTRSEDAVCPHPFRHTGMPGLIVCEPANYCPGMLYIAGLGESACFRVFQPKKAFLWSQSGSPHGLSDRVSSIDTLFAITIEVRPWA
jgi:hypothetical protein